MKFAERSPQILLGQEIRGRFELFCGYIPEEGKVRYRTFFGKTSREFIAFLDYFRYRYPREELYFILDNRSILLYAQCFRGHCDIAEALDKKIEALKAYKSEIREYPHPRSPEALRAIAMRWGSTVGCEAAEAFKLIRMVKQKEARGCS